MTEPTQDPLSIETAKVAILTEENRQLHDHLRILEAQAAENAHEFIADLPCEHGEEH